MLDFPLTVFIYTGRVALWGCGVATRFAEAVLDWQGLITFMITGRTGELVV